MRRLLDYVALCTFLFASSVSATPTVVQSDKYYVIHGSNAETLRKQMHDLGPLDGDKRYDAYTRWHIHWEYQWHYDRPSKNPCYVTNVLVSANIDQTSPRWENERDASPALQTQWQTYLANLMTHENGHVTNGWDAAAEIESELMNMPAMPNCRALQTALDKRAHEIIQQHKDWDKTYDSDTNHGRTQGAIFP